jgi:hypothetical protein
MARMFDSTVLDALRSAMEIGIHASGPKDRSVTIWVVVVDDSVFVRSYRGAKGQWYAAARATGRATLLVRTQQIPVSTEPVTDAETVGAISRAFLGKYATSAYAHAMVAPEALVTTLRLDPA